MIRLVGLALALGVLAGVMILSFYSVIAGWTLAYILKAASAFFAAELDPHRTK